MADLRLWHALQRRLRGPTRCRCGRALWQGRLRCPQKLRAAVSCSHVCPLACTVSPWVWGFGDQSSSQGYPEQLSPTGACPHCQAACRCRFCMLSSTCCVWPTLLLLLPSVHTILSVFAKGQFGVCVEQEAANRKMEYMLGVFADPIYFGDYPASVKARVSVLQPISSELVRLPRACCAAQSPQVAGCDL